MNKKHPIALALAGPLLALGACQDVAGNQDEPQLASGVGALIAASAEGATICYDRNASFGCDADEPSTIADAQGRYQLEALFGEDEWPADASVIAVLKQGEDHELDAARTLAALRGRPELISGVTDLAYHLATGDDARSPADALAEISKAYELAGGTDVFAAGSYASDARLGRLSAYLETYGALSTSAHDAPEDRTLAMRGALRTAKATTRFLTALDGTAPADFPLSPNAVSAPPSDKFTNMTFTQGMKFGAGWDDVRSTVMGNTDCLEPSQITSNKNFTEAFHLRRIRDKNDLTDSLNVSGKIVLDLSTFDATIEGSYAKLIDQKQDDVYVMASLDITLRDFHIQNPIMSFDGYGSCLKEQEDANGRCPGVNGAPGLQNNKYGTQVGTVRNNFQRKGDPEPFRKKCGDRYINTITTGGSYYGLLIIHSSSQQEKQDISASLDASIKQFTIQGKLKMLFDELSKQENVEILIMKRGVGGGDMIVTTPEQFDADLLHFKQSVCSVYPNGCDANNDPNVTYDWTKAPYRVKYESYEPTAKEIFQGGDVAADREAMDIYVYYADKYRELQDRINNMLQVPIYYVGVYGREQELLERVSDLNHHLTIIRQLYAGCDRAISRSCPNLNQNGMMEHYGLKTLDQLESADAAQHWDKLPVVLMRFPTTCAEYKEVYPSDTRDGEKLLYMGGEKANRYFMYCHELKSSNPQEFITLKKWDPVTPSASTNFSRFVGLPVTANTSGTMTTVYNKLKVLVNFDGLKPDLENQKGLFSGTVGGPVLDPYTVGTDQIVSYAEAPYATAKACQPSSIPQANINLVGTPFVVSEDVTFSVPEKPFELVGEALGFFEAHNDAVKRHGRLAVVEDAADNQALFSELAQSGYTHAWIGLLADRRIPGAYNWYPAAPAAYRNFSPDLTIKNDVLCGSMRLTDGKWDAQACRSEENAYFVQYHRTPGAKAAEVPGSDRQVFNFYLSPRLGCSTLQASSQPSFTYSFDKAVDLHLTDLPGPVLTPVLDETTP